MKEKYIKSPIDYIGNKYKLIGQIIPSYLNSIENYNDGKHRFEGWTEEHEKKLLNLLDKLDKQDTRFALNNNLKYDNPIL